MSQAIDDLRQLAHAGTARGIARHQRHRREALVEVFDDRHRLGQRNAVVLEGRHQAARIDLAVFLLALLAAVLEQVHRHRVVGQALQVQRDPHPVGCRAAEIRVELHSFLP